METKRDLQEYATSVGYRFKNKVIWCSLPGDWKMKCNFEEVTVEAVGEDWSHKLFGDMHDLVQSFVRARPDVFQFYKVYDPSFEGAGNACCVVVRECVSEDTALNAWKEFLKTYRIFA